MQPRFAAAIDPIIEASLNLMDRLNRGEAVDPLFERQVLLARFADGRAIAGESAGWELASYALASWIDELLVEHPWQGADWWGNNVLEVELFGSRLCSVRFFEQAKQAAKLPSGDALEVFHNCVVLGFRGMYASSLDSADSVHRGSESRKQEIASNLASWLRATEQMILARADYQGENATTAFIAANEFTTSPPYLVRRRTIRGAAPNQRHDQIVWWSIAVALLLALNVAAWRF